jgi:two-component system, NtrC family, nitrogen regulation sensor histidine kinase NtrY
MGLGPALGATTPAVLDLTFPSGSARWEVRHGSVRQGGRPLQLLVLSDVGRALREEERQAWQRLIRVLGHELNNSLAPIRSVADSLADLLAHEPRPHDWEDDVGRGLTVIAARSASLSRFMDAYARLARLPPPRREDVDLAGIVARVARLETRAPVVVRAGPATPLFADPDQLEQLLINLVKNAAEAAAETGGGVRVGWSAPDGAVELFVEDDGPGLPHSANLFVPFFTTKPAGSGIGLVLSRQIAEGHGGSLVLDNRPDARGCRARVRLPR